MWIFLRQFTIISYLSDVEPMGNQVESILPRENCYHESGKIRAFEYLVVSDASGRECCF